MFVVCLRINDKIGSSLSESVQVVKLISASVDDGDIFGDTDILEDGDVLGDGSILDDGCITNMKFVCLIVSGTFLSSKGD